MILFQSEVDDLCRVEPRNRVSDGIGHLDTLGQPLEPGRAHAQGVLLGSQEAVVVAVSRGLKAK